jgi:hypothetical protein
MSLPKSKIIINTDGSSRIEGLEKTEDCYKLSELGKLVGKVVEDKPKDHTPVYQTVQTKGA